MKHFFSSYFLLCVFVGVLMIPKEFRGEKSRKKKIKEKKEMYLSEAVRLN